MRVSHILPSLHQVTEHGVLIYLTLFLGICSSALPSFKQLHIESFSRRCSFPPPNAYTSSYQLDRSRHFSAPAILAFADSKHFQATIEDMRSESRQTNRKPIDDSMARAQAPRLHFGPLPIAVLLLRRQAACIIALLRPWLYPYSAPVWVLGTYARQHSFPVLPKATTETRRRPVPKLDVYL
jgi:hypothetical protein